MENDEVKDSGIIGCSELESLQLEVEELRKDKKGLQEEVDSLEDDLTYTREELEDAENKLEKLECLPEEIKSDLFSNIQLKLRQDGLMTTELEDWFELYDKFYIDRV